MALPARRIPESAAHLDVEIVAEALIRNDANIRNAARALGVPSRDLRKLVLVDQRLADAALEGRSLHLDDAEANLSEALHCGDPRRRDVVSMFMLRNTQRASKRGYAVAASPASLDVNIDTEPKHFTVVWGKPDEPDRRAGGARVPRHGRICRRRIMAACRAMMMMIAHDADDIVEGHLVQRSPMIEHEAAEPIEASEPGPAVVEPGRPLPSPPPSVTRASELRRRFALASSPIPSIRCCSAASRSSPGNIGRRSGRRGESALSSDLSRRMAY